MRVLLTGSGGMLGTALGEVWPRLRPDDELVSITRADADLRVATEVNAVFDRTKPDAVIHAAARVGGIAANIAAPTEFLLENLLIDTSVINAAISHGTPELLYVGSSCMYPMDYRQPLVEDDLLAAPLEPTNEGYAIAKIAGGKLCEYASTQHGLNYRTVIPSNLYGPHDDFELSTGHLVASAIAKVHAAKTRGSGVVDVWGDGTARREFTYVEDVASWLVGQVGKLENWPPYLNLGLGIDHSVAEYYEIAQQVVGYEGEFEFDVSKPAGMKQKLLDSSRAREVGWDPQTDVATGMAHCYSDLLASLKEK